MGQIEWHGVRRANGHLAAPPNFDGPLEVTVHAASLSGHCRILLATGPEGLAVGEDGLQEEPDHGWFAMAGDLQRFCFVNAAERASNHVTPFLLCGPHDRTHDAVYLNPTATTTQPQVRWSLRLWSSGRRHESLHFEKCRLAGYTPRIFAIVKAVIDPFRVPDVQLWTTDTDYAAFWDWEAKRMAEDRLTRRGLPGFQGENILLSTLPSTPVENPAVPATHEDVKAASVVAAVPQLLEGWFLHYSLSLKTCEVLLIANPEDRESAMLAAQVSLTALMSCKPGMGESFDVEVQSLSAMPALTDKDSRWLPLEALPGCVPLAVQEGLNGAGLWRAHRNVLEQLSASFYYSLEPRRIFNSSTGMAPAALSGSGQDTQEEGGLMCQVSPTRRRRAITEGSRSPWDAEIRIPRCVSLNAERVHFWVEDGMRAKAGEELRGTPIVIEKFCGLSNLGLVVRCGNETHVVKDVSGEVGSNYRKLRATNTGLRSHFSASSTKASPTFTWNAAFELSHEFVTAEMSAKGDVEVLFEVVNLGSTKLEEEGEGWPILATGTLLLDVPLDEDDDGEGENAAEAQGVVAGYKVTRDVSLIGLGAWEGLEGRLQAHVRMGLRLLSVTMHEIRHLLTLAEEVGRDARPFLQASLGDFHSQTEQLSGLPDEIIEHEMVFAAEGKNVVLCLELKTFEGRVHERIRAQAMLAVGREGNHRGLLPLKDTKGTVLCEVRVSVDWIDSFRGDSSTSDHGERVGAKQSPRFVQALQVLRRQLFVIEPEAAVIQKISLHFSALEIHGTDVDWAVLLAMLQSFRNLSNVRSAPSVDDTAENSALTRRLSRTSSSNQLREGIEGDARERWWKRTIYGIFKEVDQDNDGRLTRSELVRLLHQVAAYLCLTRSEACEQIERLLHNMDWDRQVEKGTRASDQAISWPGLREALIGSVHIYSSEHAGWLFDRARCREYASTCVALKVFPGLPSSYLNFTSYTGSSTAGTTSARHPLGAYLASLEGDPADPLTLFWEVVEHELGERRGNVGSKTHAEPGQSPSQAFAALQGMLVRALKNYKIAKDAWGLIIVPAIHKLPLLRGVERDGYEVMSAPVSVGDGVYSDIEVELVALPYMLASQTLTGLRTPHKDRKLRGSRVVSFHVSQAATLYLCYDRAIPKIPAWLMEAGFRDSNLFVRTTMATHRVLMLTTSTPCRIVLGGNEGYAAQKGWYKRGLEFFNYFILIGTEKRASETTPASLLPGRWLLQEHSPAFFGGQPLHDHLFAALGVNGARLTPLRSAIARDSTGKYITKTIEADIRSELKPKLHMEHNIHFSCPRVYLGLLDTSKSRDLSSKLAIRAEAITVNVSFERPLLEEADWLRLGRTDRLEGDLGLSSLDASYFNPALTAPELVIEPWGCRCLMRNRLRSAVTTVRIEAPRYFNLNISPSLADVIRDVWRPLRFDLRRYRASFDKNSDVAHKAARVVLINRLGVPLSLSPSSHGCRVLILPQPGTTGSNEHLPYVKADDSNAPPLNERSVVLEEGGRVELELDQIWNNEEEYVLPGGMRRGKHCIDLEPLGWQRVSHVGVGLAGVQAYHLTPVDHHRTHRRTQSARTGPVHSNEKWPMWTAESNSTAQRGNISSHALQHHQLHNSSSSHKSPRGDVSLSRKILMVVDAKEPHGDVPGHGSHAALHVEVRTNVRLKNMTGVVVDTKLGRGGDGVRAFLSPRGAMVMPLSIVRQQPMLSLRRLAQDDMEAVSGSPGRGMEDSGVLLHPALFDARTHEALRRTRGLEERSLALHHRVIGTVAANVATQHCEVDAGNTKDPVKQKEGEDTNLEGQHASPKKIQSPSTPDAVKARSSQTIRSQMAIDWIIAILPPYQLSNTLPCLVHIEAFQPEHTPLRGRRFQMQDIKERKHNDRSLSFGSPSSMRQGPVDPASDIFSLPLDLLPLVSSTSDARVGGDSDDSRSNFEYASNRPFTSFGEPGQKLYLDKVKAESTGVHESGEKTPVGESHENMVMVWSGCIESGHHTNLELVKLDRSLYVRVRLMGEAQPGPWSLPVHIPPWAHLNRTAFNADRESGLNEGLELWWMESGNGSEYHGDARFVRRWRLKGARRLALCADYWIINKTGLALSYRPTPLQERGGRTGSPLFEDATTGEAHAMESAQRHSPLPFEATTAPPTLGATAQGANCRFISDGIHRRCFGRTTRLPLLVSCPAKTLRTMPYALSCEALNAPLFISELRIETYGKDQVLPATVIRCFETGFPLFTNSDIRVTELPAPVQERLRRPDGVLCILRERLVAKQSNSDQQDLQDGNEMVTFVVSEDSYVYAFCCRNRPGDDSEEERGKGRLYPAWLTYEGFRIPSNSGVLLTSNQHRCYVPHRRFYSKGSTVRLGKIARHASAAHYTVHSTLAADVRSIDLSRSETSTSSTAKTMHCEQPSRLSKQEHDAARLCRSETDNNESYPAAAAVKPRGKSPRAKLDELYGAQMVFMICRVDDEEGTKELDVRQIKVERSMRDRMLCNRQYALTPHFSRGDQLYVDRKASDYALESLPPALVPVPLLAIQTAQGDRRGGNSFVMSFSVSRHCTVMVAYDDRASTVPGWLSQLSFEPTNWKISGSKPGTVFTIFRRDLSAHTTLRLGGNNAYGARGCKAMYLVMLVPSSAPLENVLPNAPSDLSVRSSDSKGWLDDELKDLIDKSDARLNVDDERLDAKDNDLSLYWNGQMNGTLRIMAPLFDTLGRDWSSPFNVDAISTTGQVETPSAVLGVSVKPLPGIFHRTRAVTLWPRFIVINRLRKSVDVLPLLRSRCLDNQSGGESGGRVMRNTVAAMLNRPSSVLEKETLVDAESNSKKTTIKGTKPLPRTGVQATPDSGALKGQLTPTDCYGVLHAGECMAIYGFLPLRFLPSNLLLPAALKKSRAAALQHHSTYQMRDDDKDETAMAHALCFRLHNADTSDESQQYSFSHPVLSEDVGETCVWFWRDSRGVYPGPLVSANVTVHASTVFMTLRDSTLSPPYRIENRSSWAYLRCKQSGTSDDTFAVGPMAYKSFSWQERDQLHRLNVSVEDIPKKDGGGPASSVATAEYSLDEVGPKETMLIASRAFFSGSGVGGFGVGGVSGSSLARSLTIKARPPQQKLYVHVSTAGRTRVITFSDLPRDDFRNRLNEMALLSWTWSLFQELYNSLDIHVGLAGFTLNLLDMDGSGRRVVELLSLTLDRLEIRKEGGKDRAQLALYHIQLDDMRPGATFAVIIQPADSGWHTPARRSKKLKAAAMAISLSSTGTGTEQQTERLAAAKEDEHVFSNLVPLVRVTAEPELHTPWSEVVHFRGLELSVQELEMRVDLDTLFSLVAYIGRLSRFDSEREERAPTGGDVYHHYYHHHRDPSIRSLRTNIMDEKSISLVRRLLRSKVRVPDAALSEAVGQRLVYIELFHHSSLIVGMELVPGGGNFPSRKERTKQTGLSGNRMDGSLGLDQELDEALVSGLELIGTGVVQLLADMARSLAQLSGLTLVFNELLFTHYFGSHYDLGHIVALSLRQQAITQSYKLLGAMDLLGNPLNLFLGFGSGVVEFFRRTQAELVGDADSKGEGLRRLAKAVIGGPFSSVSKITGTVASLLEEVVGVREMAAMAEEGMRDELSSSTARAIGHQTEDGGGSADGWRGRTPPPQHLGEGILKGGEVFYKSVKSGVKNIYDLPQQGASREGFSGFLKGMGKGVVGALAAPLIGTLGGISRVTDTTAYFEKPRILRRRRAVRVALESHALPLLEIVQVVQEEGEERREECDEKSKFEEPELRRGQKQF